MTELTLGEFDKILDYMINNNHRLIDNGDTPIAVDIEGEAGIGKTSIVEAVARRKQMTFVKVNLSQIEETADLVGFPYKEYLVKINGEEKWISADLLKDMNCDFVATNQSRMSYAVPSWVPRDENPNGTMLVLDDYSRANQLIIQAIMELINTGSYMSWKLPKYTNIVLTSNPDDGNYSVSTLDNAQRSRLVTFNAKFDINLWAKWAENFGIDGRAINFALYYNTELFEPKNNVVVANARNYTTFCRAIAGLPKWDDDKSLEIILEISTGCFLDKNQVVGTLFTQFIRNRLDKLISPEKLLNGDWDTVKQEIINCVYDNGSTSSYNYKANIANILGTRFMNYCDKYLGTDKADSKKVADRIDKFVTSETQLFSQDIMYNIVKTICSNHTSLTNRWFLNKNIRQIAI